MIDVKALMKKYPPPVTSYPTPRPWETVDCVGGYLCREVGLPRCPRFPGAYVVGMALVQANPFLAGLTAGNGRVRPVDVAVQITEENDCKRFGRAWVWLRRALRYPVRSERWLRRLEGRR